MVLEFAAVTDRRVLEEGYMKEVRNAKFRINTGSRVERGRKYVGLRKCRCVG
jgi:hypothetical protein